jgi:hypothetical protein
MNPLQAVPMISVRATRATDVFVGSHNHSNENVSLTSSTKLHFSQSFAFPLAITSPCCNPTYRMPCIRRRALQIFEMKATVVVRFIDGEKDGGKDAWFAAFPGHACGSLHMQDGKSNI